MSQIIYYHQYWMATLHDRHECQVCGEFATEAQYLENEHGCVIMVAWLCAIHATLPS
jgi:hypothetical protein